jgi:hypothetical protein
MFMARAYMYITPMDDVCVHSLMCACLWRWQVKTVTVTVSVESVREELRSGAAPPPAPHAESDGQDARDRSGSMGDARGRSSSLADATIVGTAAPAVPQPVPLATAPKHLSTSISSSESDADTHSKEGRHLCYTQRESVSHIVLTKAWV